MPINLQEYAYLMNAQKRVEYTERHKELSAMLSAECTNINEEIGKIVSKPTFLITPDDIKRNEKLNREFDVYLVSTEKYEISFS